jgi:hypothetical protein
MANIWVHCNVCNEYFSIKMVDPWIPLHPTSNDSYGYYCRGSEEYLGANECCISPPSPKLPTKNPA